MGPIIIFDKSALESLNPNEAMWLDNFYLTNIVPIFFIETLADLEKEVARGRTPESVVGSLAYKTPDMNSKPNVHHKTLLEGELFAGAKLDMQLGRPHVSGGRTVELDGKTGVIYQQSPEQEALSRWQKNQFLDLEHLHAKTWRKALSNLDLRQYYDAFQQFFPFGKPKTLDEVKKLVDFHIAESNRGNILRFGLSFIGLTKESQEQVIGRWKKEGKKNIRDFAPYFAHVFSVDFFFYLAIAADLISSGRASHKIDLAYLYYLPFCMVFTSGDKLHASIAPLFLRENQTFVLGSDLKKDLEKLNSHYATLPDEIKNRGVVSFATYPPHNDSFLTTKLWDKHMRSGWREHKAINGPPVETERTKEIMERIRRLREEGVPVADNRIGLQETDEVIFEHKVYKKKGDWMRFPPEVNNRRKNEKGEWEDIPPKEAK